MEFGRYGEIRYCVFDPTGNITALVETAVDVADQPAVAAQIMSLEPAVEQVGFVTFPGADTGAAAEEGRHPVSLRMAGGEFCGNASMCSAALYALKNGIQSGAVVVDVSGAADPVVVRLEKSGDMSFSAGVTMPPAVGFDELKLADGLISENDPLILPVVKMEGISHIIIEPDTGFYGLKDDPPLAETLLIGWCGALEAECMGMMFLDDEGPVRSLTPLVYVPGADTMFWENSCASGSAAAGIYLATKSGKAVDVTFDEPAGRLRVESDPQHGKTVLYGSARLIKESL